MTWITVKVILKRKAVTKCSDWNYNMLGTFWNKRVCFYVIPIHITCSQLIAANKCHDWIMFCKITTKKQLLWWYSIINLKQAFNFPDKQSNNNNAFIHILEIII